MTRTAKIVSVLNQKGGVGKTTMVFHLAHALKEKGKRVLCLDLDPQSNLSLLFGIEDQQINIFHLMINTIRELKGLHVPTLAFDAVHSAKGVDILPAGQELSGFELTVAGISSPRQLVLKRFLEKSGLLGEYDVILVDGPPTLGLIVVNILCASDGVLIPFQPDQFSRKGLSHFHHVLEDVEEMGISATPKIIGYIPNLVEGRRKQVKEDFEKIEEDLEFKPRVFDSFTNKIQLTKCSAQGKSVFAYKAKEFIDLQEQFRKIASSVEEAFYE